MPHAFRFCSFLIILAMSALTFVASPPTPTFAAGYKVLIVYADFTGTPTTIQSGLQGEPGIGTVDLWNDGTLTSGTTPTLATLETYDAVVLESNTSGWINNVVLGNELADYQDNGGLVVSDINAAHRSCNDTNDQECVLGRWDSGGYSPFNTGGEAETNATLSTYDHTSPIMAGVTTLTAGILMGTGAAPGAVTVASFNTDGGTRAGVVYKVTNGGTGLGVGVYLGRPSGIFNFSSQWPLVIANAIAWNETPLTTAQVCVTGSSPCVSSPDGSHGWFQHTITVTLDATMGGDPSRIASTHYSTDGGTTWNTYTGPFTLSSSATPYNLQYYSVGTNNVQETTETYASNPIKIDTTAPTPAVTATATNGGGAYTAGTWSNQSVLVHWSSPTDPESGLDPAHASCPATVVTDTGPAGQTVSCTITDNAGLSTTGSILVKVDTIAPVLSCTPSGPDSSWHGSNVSLSCSSTDTNGSGLASPGSDASFSLSTSILAGVEGPGTTDSHTSCDVAGNCATIGPLGPFLIDRKAPAASCGTADTVWHATDVSIPCTASDNGSGLASSGDASFSLTTTVPAGTESSTASTGSQQVCDAVSNCTSVGPVSGIKVDKKAPALSCATPGTGWFNVNAGIACHASDGGSGLANPPADTQFTLDTSVAPGSAQAGASTASRTVCDVVGNCASAGPFSLNIDRKLPTFHCAVPDTSLWYGSNVQVSCTAADSDSGLVSPLLQSFTLSTSVPAGVSSSSAFTSGQTVCDVAGNCASVGPFGPFKVTRAAPHITITTPNATTPLLLGSSVSPVFGCAASGAGISSCTGPSGTPDCVTTLTGLSCSGPAGGVETSTVGTHTFTVTAVDAVGNQASASARYAVTYAICPLFNTTTPLAARTGGPITLALCDAQNTDRSSAAIHLTAVKLTLTSSSPMRNFPLSRAFTYSAGLGASGGYSLTLPSWAPGHYTLYFTVAGDSVTHSISFIFQ